MDSSKFRYPRVEALEHVAVLTFFEDRVAAPLDTALDEVAVGIDADLGDTPWIEFRQEPDASVRIWLTERKVKFVQHIIQSTLALKPLCRPDDHEQH